jgi:hypothetical protein
MHKAVGRMILWGLCSLPQRVETDMQYATSFLMNVVCHVAGRLLECVRVLYLSYHTSPLIMNDDEIGVLPL